MTASSCLVHVSQLPPTVTPEALAAIFRHFGEVLSVTLTPASSQFASLRGAYVKLASPDSANAAKVYLDGRQIGPNQTLSVTVLPCESIPSFPDPSANTQPTYLRDGVLPTQQDIELAIMDYLQHSPSPPPSGCDPDAVKLFFGSIPRNLSEQDLLPMLQMVGSVVHVALLRDRVTHESKGCAFVWYRTRCEAIAAIELFHSRVGLSGPGNRLVSVRPAIVAKRNTPQSSGLLTRPSPPSSVPLSFAEMAKLYPIASLARSEAPTPAPYSWPPPASTAQQIPAATLSHALIAELAGRQGTNFSAPLQSMMQPPPPPRAARPAPTAALPPASHTDALQALYHGDSWRQLGQIPEQPPATSMFAPIPAARCQAAQTLFNIFTEPSAAAEKRAHSPITDPRAPSDGSLFAASNVTGESSGDLVEYERPDSSDKRSEVSRPQDPAEDGIDIWSPTNADDADGGALAWGSRVTCGGLDMLPADLAL